MSRLSCCYWLWAVLLLAPAARLCAEPPAAVLEAEARRVAVIDKAKRAVLAIFDPGGQGGGSGVVVSPDGYALTNFHVTAGCGNAMQCGMADGKVYDAVVVGIDPTGDVALIKLFGRDDFPVAELGDSDRLHAGDWVFAMGNPFLLATNLQPTVTYGLVSGVHRYQPPAGTLLEYTDCIQTDASINPGNSGGPMFDDQGRLVGINGRGSFQKRGRVSVGVGYAISINQIKNFLGTLHSGRIVDHATLGAVVDWSDDRRVVVTNILETSDAYRRGLRLDDEITSFGGRAISTPNGFKNMLGIFPKGWRIPITFRREGQRFDALVRLAGVHAQEELFTKVGGRPPAEPAPQPKPGEPKKPPEKDKKQPDKKQPEKPPKPSLPRRPGHLPGQEPPMPEIVKKHFEEHHGYANYYYNKQNQERVWNAWIARTRLAPAGGAWMFSGPLDNNGQYRFEITDTGASLKVPSGEVNWTAGDEIGKSLLPQHSGGLLPALYLWRRLATEGLSRFGKVYYYGTAPLLGYHGLADVLVGSHKGVECRFYFDPAEGQLLAVEMFPDDESDPCEVYFLDYREMDGRMAPSRIVVRFGDEAYISGLKLSAFKVEK